MGHYDRGHQITVDDLIDGIDTREATRSEDMAFGLWAILQRRTRLALPQVDYEESKETIYVAFLSGSCSDKYLANLTSGGCYE
jgi:hypothetical protein